MKKSRAEVNSRRKQIVAILNKTGEARVMEIAAFLKVSEITIRRDLQYLEDHKVLVRYYGGARLHDGSAENRKDLLTRCREGIARRAARLVEDGDTIFINTSSTALLMLQYITARNVSVITNNGNAVSSPKHSGVSVILTGGELRSLKGTMVGEFAMHNIERVAAKKAFLGCSGLSIENGMTTEILNEVDINKLMLERTRGESYILADHRKLGVNSSFVSCDIASIRNVITDELADSEMIAALREKGIHVELVRTEEGEREGGRRTKGNREGKEEGMT